MLDTVLVCGVHEVNQLSKAPWPIEFTSLLLYPTCFSDSEVFQTFSTFHKTHPPPPYPLRRYTGHQFHRGTRSHQMRNFHHHTFKNTSICSPFYLLLKKKKTNFIYLFTF